ncbi:MAG: gliding motility-associated-like protein [Crocinitomicaceae bacterium]|jgi:gliding motility-associated-like protein
MRYLLILLSLGLFISCGTRNHVRSTITEGEPVIEIVQNPADADSCSVVVVPEVFTPNGDGINEGLSIKTVCELSDFQFKIFNRWGELMYETDDQHFMWDGRPIDSDQFAAMGTYVYLYSFTFAEVEYTDNGNITVLF